MDQGFKGFDGTAVVADRVVVIKRGKSGGFWTSGFIRGDKTIPYHAISAIQLRKGGVNRGYIQFSITGGPEAKRGWGTLRQSSRCAVSRMVRVTAKDCAMALPDSSFNGPDDTRPRDGYNPTVPHDAAGPRVEPPMSEAWAIGTVPAATAAAAPPEEPLVE